MLQQTFTDLRDNVTGMISRVQTKKNLNRKDILFLSVVYFTTHGLILLSFPSIWTMFFYSWSSNVDGFVYQTLRLFGAFSLFLGILINKFIRTKTDSIFVTLLLMESFMVILLTFFLYDGGSYFYLMELIVVSLLIFFNGKAAKLF